MKIEVITAISLEALNHGIAEKKPDRVEGVRVMDHGTTYTAVLYWDDFCEWTRNVNQWAFEPSCIETGYAQEPARFCPSCGKPVKVRIVEPKP